MEDPISVFDFPDSELYCYMCDALLDYHEQLGICFICEMSIDDNYTSDENVD